MSRERGTSALSHLAQSADSSSSMASNGSARARRVSMPRADERPARALEPEDLEHPLDRVDQPCVPDALACIDGQLLGSVDGCVDGREHLADPVRRELERGCVRGLRHPLATPAREVGHEDVFVEVQLRLVEDDPAPRAAISAAREGPVELTSDAQTTRSRGATPGAGWVTSTPWMISGDERWRDREQIRVRRASLRGLSHVCSLAADDGDGATRRCPGPTPFQVFPIAKATLTIAGEASAARRRRVPYRSPPESST